MSIKDINFENDLLQSIKYSKMRCRFTVWQINKVADDFAGSKLDGAMEKWGEIWGFFYDDVNASKLMLNLGKPPIAKVTCWVITRYHQKLLEMAASNALLLVYKTNMFEIIGGCDIARQERFIALATVRAKAPAIDEEEL